MHAATLYSEGHQPCFESPPGSANSVQEMLIQSWGGRIRIFPAVPPTWKDAVIHRMGAEGGFAVSAVRSNGKLLWVGIEAVDYENKKEVIRCGFISYIVYLFIDFKSTINGMINFHQCCWQASSRLVILKAAGLSPAAAVATEPPNIFIKDAGWFISRSCIVILFFCLFSWRCY